jgi:hypothetical protein
MLRFKESKLRQKVGSAVEAVSIACAHGLVIYVR